MRLLVYLIVVRGGGVKEGHCSLVHSLSALAPEKLLQRPPKHSLGTRNEVRGGE